MKIIKVNLGRRSYNIIVGINIMPLLGRYAKRLNIGSHAYVLTNLGLKKRFAKALSHSLQRYGFGYKIRVVPDTEKSKSILEAYAVLKELAAYDLKKRLFLIALGGGVVGDLAGFIACVYKRGIPYVQVPTTLLAQVDSSIGGKTAVDLSLGKNLVGAFYQPRLVFSDAGLLRTLPLRQVRSGLAEVIKYGIIKDAELFAFLEKKSTDILSLKQPALEFIVARCSVIKAKIVEADEREERQIRTILNFGHTIGHAIEAACGYTGYSHGEAIALGMLAASDISQEMGMTTKETTRRIENLIRIVGLPYKIRKIPVLRIISAHYHDKKFVGAKNRFVLIKGIGRTQIVENVPLNIIRKVLGKRAGTT